MLVDFLLNLCVLHVWKVIWFRITIVVYFLILVHLLSNECCSTTSFMVCLMPKKQNSNFSIVIRQLSYRNMEMCFIQCWTLSSRIYNLLLDFLYRLILLVFIFGIIFSRILFFLTFITKIIWRNMWSPSLQFFLIVLFLIRIYIIMCNFFFFNNINFSFNNWVFVFNPNGQFSINPFLNRNALAI